MGGTVSHSRCVKCFWCSADEIVTVSVHEVKPPTEAFWKQVSGNKGINR